MTAAFYLAAAITLVFATFALIDLLSRIPAVTTLADWILGPTMPSPDNHLHLIAASPSTGSRRSTPDVLILAMSHDSIVRRRQVHRNNFCEDLVRTDNHLPHPATADQWWPGTVDSPTERRFHR